MKKSETALKKILQDTLTSLYENNSDSETIAPLVEELMQTATYYKNIIEKSPKSANTENWYKRGAIYSTYVDIFSGNFSDMEDKLDYLQSLNVSGLWLLPCLSSPMLDQGFDISHFEKIRTDLLKTGKQEEFFSFVNKAAEKGIHIIFDITLNHCSREHEWFLQSEQSADSEKSSWFHWADSDTGYEKARLLFKGIVPSNWEYSTTRKQYFFHRFYPFQPDLNYENPEVLKEMVTLLLKWKECGIAGFRLDAIPFLWKEQGTTCENLPKTHIILKIIRAIMDYAAPGTLLLAEACQPPREVTKYFGDGDECNGAYHFPLMPMIFLSLKRGSGKPVIEILKEENTPKIPKNCQWFTFLRCHDELTLEMVTPEQRKELHEFYCHEDIWDFRCGEGISSRLYNLFKGDVQKINLAWSLLFALPGTPIIYYGDEIGLENDFAFFKKKSEETGFSDSRFLVRGKIDWSIAEKSARGECPQKSELFANLKTLTSLKKELDLLSDGSLSMTDFPNGVFEIRRESDTEKLTCLFNLSEIPIELTKQQAEFCQTMKTIAGNVQETSSGILCLPACSYVYLLQR